MTEPTEPYAEQTVETVLEFKADLKLKAAAIADALYPKHDEEGDLSKTWEAQYRTSYEAIRDAFLKELHELVGEAGAAVFAASHWGIEAVD